MKICLLTFAFCLITHMLLCLCAFKERPLYAKQTQFPKSQKDVSDYILRVYENIRVFGQQKTKPIKPNFMAQLQKSWWVDKK
jgi:hypothetical protein